MNAQPPPPRPQPPFPAAPDEKGGIAGHDGVSVTPAAPRRPMLPARLPAWLPAWFMAPLYGLACILCGIVAALAMPPASQWFLLLIGLGGFYLLYTRTRNAAQAFAAGFCFAIGYFVTGLWWIGNALLVEGNDYAWVWPISVIGLPTLLGLFTATYIGLARLFSAPQSLKGALYFALFLTFSEWARGHAFTGFPWNLYGYVWVDHLAMAQGFALLGAYGMTLLSVTAVVFVARAALPPPFLRLTKRERALCALTPLALLLTLWGWGQYRLNHAPHSFHDDTAVLVVQPNIEQSLKWDPQAVQDNFRKTLSLSAAAPIARTTSTPLGAPATAPVTTPAPLNPVSSSTLPASASIPSPADGGEGDSHGSSGGNSQDKSKDKSVPGDRAASSPPAAMAAAPPAYLFIVWPETAISPAIYQHPENIAAMAGMLRDYERNGRTKAYLLTGILMSETDAQGRRTYGNSVALLDSDMAMLHRYDKHHLVPFGEFIPFQDWIPLTPVAAFQGFERGAGTATLSAGNAPSFSPLVCYEVIFPGAVALPGAAQRPDWIANVTNDGWYGDSAGPYQHFAQTRLRAIEEGLPVIRSANTGISGIIDPYGRIVGRAEIFHDATLFSSLPRKIENAPASWARIGQLLLVFASFSVIFIEMPRRRSSPPRR